MKLILILLLFPFAGKAQVYNSSAAEKFTYKEIGDTIFVKGKVFVPGDTIFLGKGSAPDHSFIFIMMAKNISMFAFPKRLPKELSQQFIIYRERKKQKSLFGEAFVNYQPVFSSPLTANKLITIEWYSAIETHEIIF